MAIFYAHTGREADKADWETVPDHVALVTQFATDFARRPGLEKAAALAAQLHDLGKYTPAFQRRLEKDSVRVDHSTAGAVLLLDEAKSYIKRTGDHFAQLAAQLIAQCIAGHHAGLPDWQGADAATLQSRRAGYDGSTLHALGLESALPLDLSDLLSGVTAQWPRDTEGQIAFRLSMLGRMIFSLLVDADFKATERFYESIGERRKDRDWPTLQACLPRFLEAFDAKMQTPPSEALPINQLRGRILDHVRGKAGMAPGLFTLNVPTGGGKTLTSLGFALDHARIHGHRRIIYAIPFTSVTEQTAAIFRDVLGEDALLEHHSGVETQMRGSDESVSASKQRLAMEDWAAPVVVTTHVQLFESLFAARTSRARKLHNIAGSIIILDEAQALPLKLLAPTVRAMEDLAVSWGCTLVLCTATQPAFDARHFTDRPPRSPVARPRDGRALAPDPTALHAELRRATLRHAGIMDDTALVDALKGTTQGFVIVNSRTHALRLFRACEAAKLEGAIHLTTRQCGAHRRAILKDVRERLAKGQPCRLIATSLIEAGVDLDFPVGWRAETGLDGLCQAAGRINRSGLRTPEESLLTVFKAAEGKPLPEIAGLIGDMERIIARHGSDPFSPEAMAEYFSEVYWRTKAQLDEGLILTDLMRLSHDGIDISYRTIAKRYQMIQDTMAPVIVPWDDTARAAIEGLALSDIPSGALSRELQPYIVQIPPVAYARLLARGHVAFAAERLRGDQFAVLRYEDLYRRDVGLVWEDPDHMEVDHMIA